MDKLYIINNIFENSWWGWMHLSHIPPSGSGQEIELMAFHNDGDALITTDLIKRIFPVDC